MILRSGQTIEVEEEFSSPQGQQRHIRVIKFPARGADGRIVGSQGLYLDISERKQAEAELAYERDLLRELLANAPDQIYFKDLQFRYIKASNSQLEHFGVAARSPQKLIVSSLFTDHAVPEQHDAVRHANG